MSSEKHFHSTMVPRRVRQNEKKKLLKKLERLKQKLAQKQKALEERSGKITDQSDSSSKVKEETSIVPDRKHFEDLQTDKQSCNVGDSLMSAGSDNTVYTSLQEAVKVELNSILLMVETHVEQTHLKQETSHKPLHSDSQPISNTPHSSSILESAQSLAQKEARSICDMLKNQVSLIYQNSFNQDGEEDNPPVHYTGDESDFNQNSDNETAFEAEEDDISNSMDSFFRDDMADLFDDIFKNDSKSQSAFASKHGGGRSSRLSLLDVAVTFTEFTNTLKDKESETLKDDAELFKNVSQILRTDETKDEVTEDDLKLSNDSDLAAINSEMGVGEHQADNCEQPSIAESIPEIFQTLLGYAKEILPSNFEFADNENEDFNSDLSSLPDDASFHDSDAGTSDYSNIPGYSSSPPMSLYDVETKSSDSFNHSRENLVSPDISTSPTITEEIIDVVDDSSSASIVLIDNQNYPQPLMSSYERAFKQLIFRARSRAVSEFNLEGIEFHVLKALKIDKSIQDKPSTSTTTNAEECNQITAQDIELIDLDMFDDSMEFTEKENVAPLEKIIFPKIPEVESSTVLTLRVNSLECEIASIFNSLVCQAKRGDTVMFSLPDSEFRSLIKCDETSEQSANSSQSCTARCSSPEIGIETTVAASANCLDGETNFDFGVFDESMQFTEAQVLNEIVDSCTKQNESTKPEDLVNQSPKQDKAENCLFGKKITVSISDTCENQSSDVLMTSDIATKPKQRTDLESKMTDVVPKHHQKQVLDSFENQENVENLVELNEAEVVNTEDMDSDWNCNEDEELDKKNPCSQTGRNSSLNEGIRSAAEDLKNICSAVDDLMEKCQNDATKSRNGSPELGLSDDSCGSVQSDDSGEPNKPKAQICYPFAMEKSDHSAYSSSAPKPVDSVTIASSESYRKLNGLKEKQKIKGPNQNNKSESSSDQDEGSDDDDIPTANGGCICPNVRKPVLNMYTTVLEKAVTVLVVYEVEVHAYQVSHEKWSLAFRKIFDGCGFKRTCLLENGMCCALIIIIESNETLEGKFLLFDDDVVVEMHDTQFLGECKSERDLLMCSLGKMSFATAIRGTNMISIHELVDCKTTLQTVTKRLPVLVTNFCRVESKPSFLVATYAKGIFLWSHKAKKCYRQGMNYDEVAAVKECIYAAAVSKDIVNVLTYHSDETCKLMTIDLGTKHIFITHSYRFGVKYDYRNMKSGIKALVKGKHLIVSASDRCNVYNVGSGEHMFHICYDKVTTIDAYRDLLMVGFENGEIHMYKIL